MKKKLRKFGIHLLSFLITLLLVPIFCIWAIAFLFDWICKNIISFFYYKHIELLEKDDKQDN